MASEAASLAAVRAENTALQQQIAALRQQLEAQRPAIPAASLNTVLLQAVCDTLPYAAYWKDCDDAQRADQMIAVLLNGINEHRARVAIVDITGVKIVDTHVANMLVRAAQAVALLGAQVAGPAWHRSGGHIHAQQPATGHRLRPRVAALLTIVRRGWRA